MNARLLDPVVSEAESHSRVLLFTIGGENYAIALNWVEAILPNQIATPIPRQPGILDGFFEYGDAVLPLVNLHKALGVPGDTSNLYARLLILRCFGFQLAIRVDSVHGTREGEEVSHLDSASLEKFESIDLRGESYLLLKVESLLQEKSGSAAGGAR